MALPHRLPYALLMMSITLSFSDVMGQSKKQMVRLAVIEVDSSRLDNYNSLLKEEVHASIEKEPGVITLYAVAEKENPAKITLFETYADSSQYKSHLTTPHFQKYKQGTLDMVKHLALIATSPIVYIRKPELATASTKDLFIRLIKIELQQSEVDNFTKLAQNVMLPGIKNEAGLLVLYAVAEKKDSTRISILEVYANASAYETHILTPHFLRYKTESKKMIKSLQITDVNPIALGAKK